MSLFPLTISITLAVSLSSFLYVPLSPYNLYQNICFFVFISLCPSFPLQSLSEYLLLCLHLSMSLFPLQSLSNWLPLCLHLSMSLFPLQSLSDRLPLCHHISMPLSPPLLSHIFSLTYSLTLTHSNFAPLYPFSFDTVLVDVRMKLI